MSISTNEAIYEGSSAQQFPVFVQPNELHFIVNRPETHKKILTVYNPYEFTLRFTVLSNTPTKYRVVMPRGFIRPKCYVDIMVRHLTPTVVSLGTDFLRVEIYREDDTFPCGRKDVPSNVLSSEPSSSAAANLDAENFVAFPNDSSSSSSRRSHFPPISSQLRSGSSGASTGAVLMNPPVPAQAMNFYWLALVSLMACVVTLFLPAYEPHDLQNKRSQQLSAAAFVPVWLQPSHTLQLVAAYVLGLLTVYFFIQPNT